MKIELISSEIYDRLVDIYNAYPNLSLQNNGYEYINKSKLTEEELTVWAEIETILRLHIDGFVKFYNFRLSRAGEIQVRFDYYYDHRFVGVGYLELGELLNGFK